MKQHSLSTPTIIHLFAMAHAAIAILSRIANYVDDVPLTILTLTLVAVISLRHHIQAEMIAVMALVGTFAGYLLGSFGGEWVALVVHNELLAPAITTALLTELLGWGVYAFAYLRGDKHPHQLSWSPPIPQIVLIVLAILLFRISYTLIFSSPYFMQSSITTELHHLLGNTVAILLMLCGNMLFVSVRIGRIGRPEWRTIGAIIFTIGLSTLVTLLVYYDFPQGNDQYFSMPRFLRQYAVILLCDIVVYAIFKLVSYVLISRAELHAERGKKHQAQFRYNKLKMQINPHFLFNSLNILDYLVQEQENDRASAFIRKLADCYRYMLKNEDEALVPLQEELTFARKYGELLQERFANGFVVRYEIPSELYARHIIPCALQLLIENATKHNIVSPDQPLEVLICGKEDRLTISNRLQPRMSKQPSTGKGLKNIQQQYLDLADRTVRIEQSETEFIVELPLL